jgi:uncharacterized Zn-finger protein
MRISISDLLNPTEPRIKAEDETSMESAEYSSQELPSPTDKRKFVCEEPGCMKGFTRKYNLSAHMRCHRSEKPFSWYLLC